MSNDPHLTAPPSTTTLLGYAPMDAVHAEFDALLNAALQATGDLHAQLAQVVAHLREHFEAEGRFMNETDYPHGECHLQEHAAVLASAHEVLALDAARRPAVARAFFGELAAWFPAHSQHLDSALAHWMCKRAHGGKPVVFHTKRQTSGHVAEGVGIESVGETDIKNPRRLS
jgi:hemerythrin